MSTDNIEFSDSKKVVLVESISPEEQSQIQQQVNVSLAELRKKRKSFNKSTIAFISAGAVIALYTAVAGALHVGNITPDNAGLIVLFDGVVIALPTFVRGAGLMLLDGIIKETIQSYDDVSQEKNELEKIEQIRSKLSESIELTDNQKLLKKGCIEFMLGRGADPEIVGMESIQKLFDIAASAPSSSVGPRVFKYNTVKEDGTFTISSHIKLPVGMMGPDDSITYEIHRIENGDQDHFLEVFCEDGIRIIVNQEGKVTSIESKTISVPLTLGEEQKDSIKK